MAAVSPPVGASAEHLTVDDTMEISSDAGRHVDTDIEIDVENDTNLATASEDEFMLEDDVQVHTEEGNDDIMLDDDHEHHLAEPRDEVLRDASVDLDPDITIVDDKTISQSATAPDAPAQDPATLQDSSAEAFGDHHDFALADPTNEQTTTAENIVATEPPTESKLLPSDNNADNNQVPKDAAGFELTTENLIPQAEETATAEDEITFDDNTTHINETSESVANPADQDAPSAPVETLSTAETHTSELHPSIVVYEGTDMDLFLSAEPETESHYLLSDKSLAHVPLPEFMTACRAILAGNIGSGEELELSIAELGLTFHERLTEHTPCTFADLTQIYVQLSQNDGVENPGPLYVTLTHKASFAARVDELMSAASEGKGLSDVTLDEFANEDYPDPEDLELQTGTATQDANEETRAEPVVQSDNAEAEEISSAPAVEAGVDGETQQQDDKLTAHDGTGESKNAEGETADFKDNTGLGEDAQESHHGEETSLNTHISSASSTIQGDEATGIEDTEQTPNAETTGPDGVEGQNDLLDGDDQDEIDFLDDENAFELNEEGATGADQDEAEAPATQIEQNELDETAEEAHDDFDEGEDENHPNGFEDLLDSNPAAHDHAGEDEIANSSIDFSAPANHTEDATNANVVTDQGSPGVNLEDVENHDDPDVDEFIDYDEHEEDHINTETDPASEATAQDKPNVADFVAAANATASLSRKRSWVEQSEANTEEEAAVESKRSRAT